jgi:hypothetical protein
MYREYFRRAAKNWTRCFPSAAKSTTHSPKSNWVYSPGSPSKRTTGSCRNVGRSVFTSAVIWLRPPS